MRGRIVEPGCEPRSRADDAVEIRADAVRLALAEGVAGGALLGRGLALLDRRRWPAASRSARRLRGAAAAPPCRLLRDRDLEAGLRRLVRRETRASAAMLSDSRHRQVNSKAPRILLSSKESIAARLPKAGISGGIGAGAAPGGPTHSRFAAGLATRIDGAEPAFADIRKGRRASRQFSMNSDVLILIPARMASTRLPGKPLADIGGVPMIVHVMRARRGGRGRAGRGRDRLDRNRRRRRRRPAGAP